MNSIEEELRQAYVDLPVPQVDAAKLLAASSPRSVDHRRSRRVAVVATWAPQFADTD
ncbi:hypothetical protein G9U51_05300 [Calidifontibacter sp. DB0510]|uniref:Uncharacterized protein n=1 Tax=Metallococcus carri TaxID=1656884 RepID=A0A967B0K4_9MICO|nr:hypothetical protein [Metallococcus carri]NHN55205.1 hypothetical protein [Metallococcus carri]NOP36282.1 hypothetical protein [Calidifontibacter sp. DB2511S]